MRKYKKVAVTPFLQDQIYIWSSVLGEQYYKNSGNHISGARFGSSGFCTQNSDQFQSAHLSVFLFLFLFSGPATPVTSATDGGILSIFVLGQVVNHH